MDGTVFMNWAVPIIEKVRWIYPPPPPTNSPLIHTLEGRYKFLNDNQENHSAQLTNLTTFTQVYANRYSSFKHEYEQKIIMFERNLAEIQNQHKTHIKKLEDE